MRPWRSGKLLGPAVALAALMSSGCADGWKWNPFARHKKPPPEPVPRKAPPSDPVLLGTIGQYTWLSGAETLRLRGFGLVVGLGDQGSADCPTSVRQYLIDYFARQAAAEDESSRPRISPPRLIDSLDTAAVELIADIPPGAPAGTPLDIKVSALDAQTHSLEGGVLLASELKIFKQSPGGVIAGRPLARASGPVFTNPFTAAGDAAADARHGFVLGGGRTLEDRNVRMLLEQPSYSLARRIEQRINERFGQRPKASEAMSRGYLELYTPPAWTENPNHFLDLVTHLYLDGSPNTLEARLRELAERVDGSPPERLEHISLVWEANGRKALADIQRFYEHADPAVRYYAARAGLRLGDAAALPVLTRNASHPDSPFKVLAVREIGAAGVHGSTDALVRLLSAADTQVRVTAYEELVDRPTAAIRSERFRNPINPALVNFTLDLVRSDGEPLIYVRRTGEPRIAIFGPTMPIATPLFYDHPQQWVTLNTSDARGEITVLSRSRGNGRFNAPFHVPARVADLVRALANTPRGRARQREHGLGLPYSLVVQVLDALHRQHLIAANVVVEQRSLSELLGPTPRRERPEADAPPPPDIAGAAEIAPRPPAADTTHETTPPRPEANPDDGR